MTSTPGGTSRVTTAPAPTKASAPTSTPGSSTAPLPIRQPRRRIGPRRSIPGGLRPAGGYEDVVLDHRPRGHVRRGLQLDARAQAHVVLDRGPAAHHGLVADAGPL